MEELRKSAEKMGEVFLINPSKDIVFSERAVLKCAVCGNYGKRTCPPLRIDYKKAIKEYEKGFIIIVSQRFNEEDKIAVKEETGKKLHIGLIKLEEEAFDKGFYYITSLIGGSCKLCKKCSEECSKPTMARVPLEGVGCDVVETVKSLGISLKFPPNKKLCRVGLLLLK